MLFSFGETCLEKNTKLQTFSRKSIHQSTSSISLGAFFSFLDGNLEDWKCLFDTNVLAVGMCTRQALKSMEAHGVNDGHIVNINR